VVPFAPEPGPGAYEPDKTGQGFQLGTKAEGVAFGTSLKDSRIKKETEKPVVHPPGAYWLEDISQMQQQQDA
jgi:hypothetical protein